jgi:prepilin-type N-terminal cleavage/methylation domain-containing protein
MNGRAGPATGRQAGFSLIEILITAVVLGILTTSVVYFLSSQNDLGVRSADLMAGLNLGKLKMDSLKVSGYADLASGSDTVSQKFIRSWRVSLMHDAGGMPSGRKKIETLVLWPLSADHNLSFTSVICDEKYKEAP